jgi:hypothetical protein
VIFHGTEGETQVLKKEIQNHASMNETNGNHYSRRDGSATKFGKSCRTEWRTKEDTRSRSPAGEPDQGLQRMR